MILSANFSQILYSIVLIFSILAFGMVEVWSQAVIEILIFLSLGLCLLGKYKRNERIYYPTGLIPFSLLLLFLLSQIVPLPPSLVKLISPETYSIYQDTSGVLVSTKWIPISLNIKLTLNLFFRYLAYLGIYTLTIQLVLSFERIKKVLFTMVGFFSLYAIFTLIQFFSKTDKIYWFFEILPNQSLFGSYLDQNLLAGLAGMVLPILCAFYWHSRPHITYKQSVKEKIKDLIYFPSANTHMLIAAAILLLAAIIIISSSKIAVFSLVASSFIIVGLVFLKAERIRKRPGLTYLAAVAIFLIAWVLLSPIFESSFSKDRLSDQNKQLIWIVSKQVAADFPLMGVGFGNYGKIFPKYQDAFFSEPVTRFYNGFIEILVEGGILALILLSWWGLSILNLTIKTYMKRRDAFSVYIFLGSVCGIMTYLSFSFFNYGYSIAANGLYIFFITGLAVAAICADRRNAEPFSLRPVQSRTLNVVFVSGAFIALAICVVINAGASIAAFKFKRIESVHFNEYIPKSDLESYRRDMKLITWLDPFEAKYRFALASIQTLLLEKPSLIPDYSTAIYLDPLNSGVLQQAGLVAAWDGKDEYANQLLTAGIKNDPSNPVRYKTYADWLFSKGDKATAIKVIQSAINKEAEKDQNRIEEYITYMILNDLDNQEMLEVMSEHVFSLLTIADYFLEIKKASFAENAFDRAVLKLENHESAKIIYYQRIYDYYASKHQTLEALNLALQAIGNFPDAAAPRIWAAQIYEEQRITYRAVQEYQNALSADPQNTIALAGLKRLSGNNL